ncbi:tyrosine-type recombinase/integrase [Oscillatoria amoena NRMC-F 0135]|nr:tyrosine-type recombinase/integrase [Oscillatoria amoena NRMC-F 0135]
MVIKNAIEIYLNWKKSYAPTAALRYKTRLDSFLSFVGDNTPMTDITGDYIINFHRKMEREGYSRTTIAYSANILKNFYEFWSGRGIHTVNPKEIRIIRYTAPQKEGVSEANFKQMVGVLHEGFFSSLQRKLALYMLYDTGMRVSELCELNISDLQDTSITGMHCAVVRRRKTFRYNTVVWGSETNRLLNLYLGLRFCMDDVETDALFTTFRSKNKHIPPRTVERWVKETALKAGIERKISPHCFRHAKAHSILNKSGNVRDVQAILGHTNPQSSFNYLQVNKERFMEIAREYVEITEPVKVAA